MKKSIITLTTAVIMAVSMSMTAWAGEQKNPPANAIEINYEVNPDCLEFIPGTCVWKCKVNGAYITNRWVHLDFGSYDIWRYFDQDGFSLRNAETPDGYWIDNDGNWVKPATGEYVYDEIIEIEGNSFTKDFDNTKNKILTDQAARICFKFSEDTALYETTTVNGATATVVDNDVITIQFCSEHSNVNPDTARVLIWPAISNTDPSLPVSWWADEPTEQLLEYDKDYPISEFLQMVGTNGVVVIDVADKNMNGSGVEKNGLQIRLTLKPDNSVPINDVKNGNDCLHHCYNTLK